VSLPEYRHCAMMTTGNFLLPLLRMERPSVLMIAGFAGILALGAFFAYFPLGILGFTVLFFLFAVFFVRPAWGLLMIVLFMPVKTIMFTVKSPVRSSPDIIHLYFIPIFFMAGILLLHYLSRARKDYPGNALTPLVAAIFGWAVISLFWTDDMNHGINTLLSLTECALVIPLFGYFLKDRDALKKLLIFSFVVGLLLSAATTLSYWYDSRESIELFQDVTFKYGLNKEQDRPGGLAPANHTANILALFIMLSVALFYWVTSAWARAFIAAACLFALFNIFFTGSKGGVGSVVLGLLFLILSSRPLRKRWISWTLAVGAAAFLAMVSTSLVTGEGILQQRTIASAAVASISFSTRLEFWKIGLEYLWDTFGFGAGIGGFARLVDPWPAAHSLYFSVLFDLGVIGFLLFGWLFFRLLLFLRASFRACRDDEVRFTAQCLAAYLVVFLVHGIVDFDYVYFPAWMMASFLMAALFIGAASRGGEAEGEGLPAPGGASGLKGITA
jgi:O-antigen ligase